jgi:hypothetical protein
MLWYLKQLLPFTYRSHYFDSEHEPHLAVWRMWLGRCFDVEDVVILRTEA